MHALAHIADRYLERAHVPFSGRPAAAVALLSDGRWVPGVRVENASFPLTLEASVNAVTAAVAAGRRDIVALLPDPREPSRSGYMAGVAGGRWTRSEDGILVRDDASELPEALGALDLVVHVNPGGPMPAARLLADRAVVTESDFPVSCVLDLGDGRGIPGVNVEHEDWTGILCAERNALGTWVTLGRPPVSGLHLTCLKDSGGTPCGACRQWLVELVPDLPVHMDRGAGGVEVVSPRALLPGAFTGRSLRPGAGR
jgi:cytidine deaminase